MSLDDNEDLDSSTQTDDGNDKGQDDSVVETDDVAKLKEQNTRLFERAKRAEGFVKQDDGKWIKKPKPVEQPKPETKQTNSPPTTDADELRLIAKGLSDEEIDQAKIIAKGTDKTLAEAIKSDLFVAFQEKLKEQQKKEKARLNASKGSSQETRKSPSEMTRSEHEAWAKEMAANIQ